MGDAQLEDPGGRAALDLLALPDHAAGPRGHQAGDGARQRGRAGAVGADQGGDLAVAHHEVHVPKDGHLPVARLQALDAQQLAGARRRGVARWCRHGFPDACAAICAYFLPRYASMTCWLDTMLAGEPSAMSAPLCRTTIREQIDSTTFMRCSISTIVTPVAAICRISPIACSTSAEFSPALTSSRKSSRGFIASALASSRRLRMASVSVAAGWSAAAASPTNSSCWAATSRALRSPPLAPLKSAAAVTFSSTLSSGNGCTTWNVRAIPARAAWYGR